MNNKGVLQLIMTISFALMVFIPGLLLLSTGGEERLSGEESYALSDLTADNWLSQTFQKSFENWFSRSYNGRQMMVRSYAGVESMEAVAEHNLLDPLRIGSQGEDKLSSMHAAVDELAAARKSYATPLFPEYGVEVSEVTDQSSFQGTADDIVGKDGVLFSNAYVDEVFGFSLRYSNVTDEELERKVEQLAYIQQQLKNRGIAFTVAITPNKAAYYAEYIPDWYVARHTMPEGYKRPYTRFLEMLKKEGVSHVDSGAVFAENGLRNSFPITGIHWNALTSVPVAQAVMEEGAKQLGVTTRGLTTTGVTSKEGRIDFEEFDYEQDIFQLIFAERPEELKRAIVDPYYYYPITEIVNQDAKPLNGVWIQGGSFRFDIYNKFVDCGYADALISSDYNNVRFERDGTTLSNWEELLSSVSHVVFEVNEQFVFNMGGSPFWEIDENISPGDIGDFNVHDALEEYLRSGDSGTFENTQETGSIVIGDNGNIFQRGTIAELYGLSSLYTDVTDDYLSEKAERLAEMENALRERGIAFTVLITPSKAAMCEEDIPDWYKSRLEMPADYVRPSQRLGEMLHDRQVTVLDSSKILKEKNIAPSYAFTAARWNPVASLTVTQAVLAEFAEQTGRVTRNWKLEGVQEASEPYQFKVLGNVFTNEKNLLNELPDGFDYSLDGAVYEVPKVHLEHMDRPRYEGMLLHGGDYTYELTDWIGEHLMGIDHYRNNDKQVDNWDELMSTITYVVIEINETSVYDMDMEMFGSEYSFMDEFYQYLVDDKGM